MQWVGGEKVLDLCRGGGFKGHTKGDEMKIDPKDWNLPLPCVRTLQYRVPPVDPYAGVGEDIIKVFSIIL